MSADAGFSDNQALVNNRMTAEERQRLIAATTLTPEQQAALDRGELVLRPEQLAYLAAFSKGFGDKSPAEIKAIMDRMRPDGGRIADTMALASNPHITTGLLDTGTPSIFAPAKGGAYALPDGVQKPLNAPAWQVPTRQVATLDPLHPTTEIPSGAPPFLPTKDSLNDLASIIERGNPALQRGSDLDVGVMNKVGELVGQSNEAAKAGLSPGFYQAEVDPTLQHLLTATGRDPVVVHDALAGINGQATPATQSLIGNLFTHQWADHGAALSPALDNTIGQREVMTNPGDLTQLATATRAGETAQALAHYTAQNGDMLLNMPGAGEVNNALGQVNPLLDQALGRNLLPYIGDILGNHLDNTAGFTHDIDDAVRSPTLPLTKQLFAVINSDPTAAAQFNGQAYHDIAAYQDRFAESLAGKGIQDIESFKSAGTLQAVIDQSAIIEAKDRIGNVNDAAQVAYDLRK